MWAIKALESSTGEAAATIRLKASVKVLTSEPPST
jgi:hypothetical protein